VRAHSILALALVPLLVTACGTAAAPANHDAAVPPPLQAPDKHVVWRGADATVYEIPSLHMLEVTAPSEKSGVDAEYRYLQSLRCGPSGSGEWTSNEQSLLDENGRQYDVLHAVCSETGEQRDFKFDITQYFGLGLR
jgi:hypothetical protein